MIPSETRFPPNSAFPYTSREAREFDVPADFSNFTLVAELSVPIESARGVSGESESTTSVKITEFESQSIFVFWVRTDRANFAEAALTEPASFESPAVCSTEFAKMQELFSFVPKITFPLVPKITSFVISQEESKRIAKFVDAAFVSERVLNFSANSTLPASAVASSKENEIPSILVANFLRVVSWTTVTFPKFEEAHEINPAEPSSLFALAYFLSSAKLTEPRVRFWSLCKYAPSTMKFRRTTNPAPFVAFIPPGTAKSKKTPEIVIGVAERVTFFLLKIISPAFVPEILPERTKVPPLLSLSQTQEPLFSIP